MDIANGPGCRISIFVQGCEFGCPGCFNKVARDFSGGKEFTDQSMDLLLELAKPDYISPGCMFWSDGRCWAAPSTLALGNLQPWGC